MIVSPALLTNDTKCILLLSETHKPLTTRRGTGHPAALCVIGLVALIEAITVMGSLLSCWPQINICRRQPGRWPNQTNILRDAKLSPTVLPSPVSIQRHRAAPHIDHHLAHIHFSGLSSLIIATSYFLAVKVPIFVGKIIFGLLYGWEVRAGRQRFHHVSMEQSPLTIVTMTQSTDDI